jgi:hypothetical protein
MMGMKLGTGKFGYVEPLIKLEIQFMRNNEAKRKKRGG